MSRGKPVYDETHAQGLAIQAASALERVGLPNKARTRSLEARRLIDQIRDELTRHRIATGRNPDEESVHSRLRRFAHLLLTRVPPGA